MQIQLTKPIVLVGLMGCGKTSIGKRLAKRLEVSFVDSDHEIEAQEASSVSAIFAEKGEAYFRQLERETIAALLAGEPRVIATGGGAFMQEDTRKLILDQAISIWLYATLPVLLERVKRKNTRPLLEQGDKETILKELMDERYPIYDLANIHITSRDIPHTIVVDEILEALNEFS